MSRQRALAPIYIEIMEILGEEAATPIVQLLSQLAWQQDEQDRLIGVIDSLTSGNLDRGSLDE